MLLHSAPARTVVCSPALRLRSLCPTRPELLRTCRTALLVPCCYAPHRSARIHILAPPWPRVPRAVGEEKKQVDAKGMYVPHVAPSAAPSPALPHLHPQALEWPRAPRGKGGAVGRGGDDAAVWRMGGGEEAAAGRGRAAASPRPREGGGERRHRRALGLVYGQPITSHYLLTNSN